MTTRHCLLLLSCWLSVVACRPAAQHKADRDGTSLPAPQPPPSDSRPALAAPAPVTPVQADLVISELQTAPLLHDEPAGDYFEVVNLSRFAVPLSELAVVLPSGKRVVPERPARPWLAAGEVSVWQSAESPQAVRVRGLRLPNRSGRLELWWRGRPVDVAHWLRTRPWPKLRPGVAWERKAPRSDGTQPRGWRPAKAAKDAIEAGSPGVVDWPCEQLLGTALARPCPPPPPRRILGCGGAVRVPASRR